MFQARIEASGADRLVERVVHHGAEHLAIADAKAPDGLGIQAEFADRAQDETLLPPRAALGQGIELADGLDLIAEEIDAQRGRRAGRKHVDDAAPKGEFAGLGHISAAGVAVGGEKGRNYLRRQGLALYQFQHGRRETGLWRQTLKKASHGRDNKLSTPRRGCQPAQPVDAPRDDVAMGRYPVIRQAIPGRHRDDLQLRREESQILDQPGHAQIVDADMQELARIGEFRQNPPVKSFGGAAQPASARPIQRQGAQCCGHRRLGHRSRSIGRIQEADSLVASGKKLAVRSRHKSSPIPAGRGSRPVSQL